jgi:hypothetical protein
MTAEPDPYATQLMMRELAHPTQACVEVVREYIRPMADILRGILGELLPEADPVRIYMTGFSIVGQCLFYKQNRPVAQLLMGERDFATLDADRIAEHVTAFTLRGLGVQP